MIFVVYRKLQKKKYMLECRTFLRKTFNLRCFKHFKTHLLFLARSPF